MPMRLMLQLLFVLLILSACAPLVPITKTRAVEIATRECKTPHLVMVSEPQNIRATLLTLKDADPIFGEGSTSYGLTMTTPVWLVQMDGDMQQLGGPRPPDTPVGQLATATPPPVFHGTCSVVIHASTGDVLSRRD